MISSAYQKKIKKIIAPILKESRAEVFIFGTAARAVRFGDVDLAINGQVSRNEIRQIKVVLEDSNLPYFFDVVDFKKTTKSFRDNILNNKIIWLIKRSN
ncbi:MAG: nucleotidyltransferase domain-containing protein [bacterium]